MPAGGKGETLLPFSDWFGAGKLPIRDRNPHDGMYESSPFRALSIGERTAVLCTLVLS